MRVSLADGYTPYGVVQEGGGNRVWVGAGRATASGTGQLQVGWVDSALGSCTGSQPLVLGSRASVDDAMTAVAAFDGTRVVVAGEYSLALVSGAATTSVAPGDKPYAVSATTAGPSDVWVGSRAGLLYHVTGPAPAKLVYRAALEDMAGVWAHGNALHIFAADGLRRVALPVPQDWDGESELETLLRGALAQEGVAFSKVESVAVGDGYELVVDGERYDVSNGFMRDQGEALDRLLGIANLLLSRAGSSERLYGVGSGNDAAVILLSPALASYAATLGVSPPLTASV